MGELRWPPLSLEGQGPAEAEQREPPAQAPPARMALPFRPRWAAQAGTGAPAGAFFILCTTTSRRERCSQAAGWEGTPEAVAGVQDNPGLPEQPGLPDPFCVTTRRSRRGNESPSFTF